MFLQAIPPESSVGNGKTPLLADWHGFGVFLSVFRPPPRRRCPSLTPGPNCTKLFLGLLQAISPELGVGSGNLPVLADYPNFALWSNFWLFFSAGSKTTLSCAYLWTELHQTRFPVLLQAIPYESSVGNGKKPLLADWHCFGTVLAVFRLAPMQRCPALTLGHKCTKLGFLGFCRLFHRNQALETGKYQY